MLSGSTCRDPSSWCRGITCSDAKVRSGKVTGYRSAGSFPPPVSAPTWACWEPAVVASPMALSSWAAGTEPRTLTFGDVLLKVAWGENSILSCTSLPGASASVSTLL